MFAGCSRPRTWIGEHEMWREIFGDRKQGVGVTTTPQEFGMNETPAAIMDLVVRCGHQPTGHLDQRFVELNGPAIPAVFIRALFASIDALERRVRDLERLGGEASTGT